MITTEPPSPLHTGLKFALLRGRPGGWCPRAHSQRFAGIFILFIQVQLFILFILSSRVGSVPCWIRAGSGASISKLSAQVDLVDHFPQRRGGRVELGVLVLVEAQLDHITHAIAVEHGRCADVNVAV